MSHPLTACISEIELLQERIAEKNDRIEALEVALMTEWAARDNRIEALEGQIQVMQQALLEQSGRINDMRAALREIKDQYLTPEQSSAIARKALVPEQDKS